MIKYFGYGSNKDLDMMTAMVGNKNLIGEPGQLLGYELCIQKIDQIRDFVPKDSPINKTPRELINLNFDDNFELFIARPKEGGIISGTIWELTPEELGLVKEWECVDYGMQEEIQAKAIDQNNQEIDVETQAMINPAPEIDRVVNEENYEPYIVEKEKMLEVAEKVRREYLERNAS